MRKVSQQCCVGYNYLLGFSWLLDTRLNSFSILFLICSFSDLVDLKVINQDGPYLEFHYPGTSKAFVKDYAMIKTIIEVFDREANENNPSWRSSCEEHIVDMNVLLAQEQGESRKKKSSGSPSIPVEHTTATTGLSKVLLGKIHPFQLMVTSRSMRFLWKLGQMRETLGGFLGRVLTVVLAFTCPGYFLYLVVIALPFLSLLW
jgi:hypothetical protein